jgi:hypothetical protein
LPVTLAVTTGSGGDAGVQRLWGRLGVLSGALGGGEKWCEGCEGRGVAEAWLL